MLTLLLLLTGCAEEDRSDWLLCEEERYGDTISWHSGLTTYSYDEEDRVVWEEHYERDRLEVWIERTWRDDGLLESSLVQSRDGYYEHAHYYYDEAGHLVLARGDLDGDGNTDAIGIQQWEGDLLMASGRRLSDRRIVWDHTYHYDERGNLLVHDGSGTSDHYEYDALDRLVREYTIYQDGVRSECADYLYDDRGFVEEEVYSDCEGEIHSTRTWSRRNDGQPRKRLSDRDDDGHADGLITWSYDRHGNESEELAYSLHSDCRFPGRQVTQEWEASSHLLERRVQDRSIAHWGPCGPLEITGTTYTWAPTCD